MSRGSRGDLGGPAKKKKKKKNRNRGGQIKGHSPKNLAEREQHGRKGFHAQKK